MPFFIVLIVFLYAFLYTLDFFDKKLKIFYKTYTTEEIHLLGILLFILASLYFLKPIYQKLSGKIDEKYQLKQLHSDLLKNHNKDNKNYIWGNSPEINLSPKSLPSVIKKIALITGEGSAGYIDFNNTLQCGEVLDYNAVMNENAPKAVIDSIIKNIEICNQVKAIDIICITRGGGSYLRDIFDDKILAEAIKGSSKPILLGTGHAKDCSLCDKVSDSPIDDKNNKLYFITPTALAQFLNDYNEKQLKKTSELLKKMNTISDSIDMTRLACYSIVVFILYRIFYIL